MPRSEPWPWGSEARRASNQGSSERRRDRSERLAGWVGFAIVLGTWIFLLWMHADNNGLWFQGDSPRHAANGLFWQDFLRDFTFDAKAYALRYYARYPAINPAAYPPLFYLLEAAAFGLFGSSPLIAKGLVLIFSLVAALYTLAWLNRWISPYLSWAAALLLLTPGIVVWSHAVMLNVPALALTVGVLYHARRWLEIEPLRLRSTHFYLTVCLTVLSVSTYYPAGSVILVVFVWMLGRGGWRGTLGWRAVVLTMASAALLVPCVIVAARFVPTHVNWVTRALIEAIQPKSWTFYLTRAPIIFGSSILLLASAGWVLAMIKSRWRGEVWWLSLWILVTYCSFSVLVAKEGRYILSVAPALICLAAIALLEAAQKLGAVFPRSALRHFVVPVLATVVLFWQMWGAWHQPVPTVEGFREVAAFLEEVAPAEPIFYDGYHSGVFTFRVRAADPYLERQVVLGNKVLYTYALHSGWRDKQFAGSVDDVIDLLRSRGGCRWLAIEIGERSQLNPAMQLLREAVATPAFELVRSFPIRGPRVERVDIYRLLGVVETPRTISLPFPLVSSDTLYEVEPIPSRRRDSDPPTLK